MKKLATCILGAGLSLLLATTAHAVGTFSHFETTAMPGNTVFSTSGNSSIIFLPGFDNGVDATGGGTDIVLANLDLDSTSATADEFNAPYTIIMNLTDDTTGLSGQLTFTGVLGGSASANAANVNNLFDEPQSQILDFGGIQYVVTIGPYVPVGPPASGRQGAIGAHVTAIPEPGSLALLGAGLLPLTSLIRRRKIS